ncbi:ABC transporter ATP-binding protein [Paenibacillus sp. TRM 82003]|nr:ABC transporter ATP-binding protein [Paenibacillus sp. TRM 82003]
MEILQALQLSFGYGSGDTIREVTAGFRRGETVAIVGPNGAGKTTLIKCLAAIYKPRRGSVLLDGKPLHAYAPKERARRIGYVPQSAAASFPLTVTETVLLGRRPYVKWGVGGEDLRVVNRILDDLELSRMAERYIDELSGGERQKVMLARALAQEPDILMLDEPIAALDIRHQLSVLEKVRQLARRDGTLAIMILHDLELASRYADTVVLMKDGRVVTQSEPERVLTADYIKEVYGVETLLESGPYGLKITAVQPI